MTTVLSILILVSSIALIVSALISEPAENNMSAIMGGGASDSFWEIIKAIVKKLWLTKLW